MFSSQYTILVDEGSPILVRMANTGEQRVLIVDLNNDNQVHAVTKEQVDNLAANGRLYT